MTGFISSLRIFKVIFRSDWRYNGLPCIKQQREDKLLVQWTLMYKGECLYTCVRCRRIFQLQVMSLLLLHLHLTIPVLVTVIHQWLHDRMCQYPSLSITHVIRLLMLDDGLWFFWQVYSQVLREIHWKTCHWLYLNILSASYNLRDRGNQTAAWRRLLRQLDAHKHTFPITFCPDTMVTRTNSEGESAQQEYRQQ